MRSGTILPRSTRFLLLLGALLLLPIEAPAGAQSDRAATVAVQREAMQKLAFMDGDWRGPSWTDTSKGRLEMVLTERIGTLLDGTVRILNGRGYRPDGSVGYQALGIIDYDTKTQAYRFTTWSLGSTRTFPLKAEKDGFSWATTSPDGAQIRYRARIGNGVWHETGERVAPGGSTTKVTDIRMQRLGDTGWPARDPVPMK